MGKRQRTLIGAVRQAAREAEITQTALADLAGITRAALCRFLNGTRCLREPALDRLATVLKLKVVATGKAPAIAKRKPGPKGPRTAR